MRRYDDLVEVRKGEAGEPEEFLWRGRLWRVRSVVAQWVETGPWWTAPSVRAVLGAEGTSQEALGAAGAARSSVATLQPSLDGLLGERELWRVEAVVVGAAEPGFGVFDLAFSWGGPEAGCWRLTGCLD